jgi:hypothetical protein
MSLGTVTLLIPWGEADGQPIDIPIPFRIESESFGLVEGQLGVRIVAALDFDEAKANGQVFQVRAVDENGLDTGLQVDRGQILRFASRGVISFDAGNHFATPDGLPCTQNGERIRLLGSELDGYFTQGDLLMQGQRLGAIVGWIGKPEEHTVFLVGSSSTVVVTTEGTLRLAVNDVRGQFNDNIGYFEVAVREE